MNKYSAIHVGFIIHNPEKSDSRMSPTYILVRYKDLTKELIEVEEVLVDMHDGSSFVNRLRSTTFELSDDDISDEFEDDEAALLWFKLNF